MHSSSQRRIKTFQDEEDEPVKHTSPLQQVPENIFNPKYMEDILTSPTVKRTFKERGLVFEGVDLKSPPLVQTKKQVSGKVESIAPEKSGASVEELIAELKKAESQSNNQLMASILETLLAKGLNATDKVAYQLQKCHVMSKLERYSEGMETALDILRGFESLSDTILFRTLLVLSKCRLEMGEADAGYLDYLKVEGILWDWEARNLRGRRSEEILDGENLESWKESDYDKDILSAEELKMLYQLRHTKETHATYTCYVTGTNIQNYLHGINEDNFKLKEKSAFRVLPELRNLRVLSVTCGDHHTLALVDGNSFNLYNIEDVKKVMWLQTERNNFGTLNVFGWGENDFGQITGYPTQQNITKPTFVRYFLGKEIQGINANGDASIAFDGQGNLILWKVYEWGYRQPENASIDITFTENSGIHSARIGKGFSAVLTNHRRLFVRGNLPGVQSDTKSYQEIEYGGHPFKQIDCGDSHIIALDEKAQIFSFGSNVVGQLGVSEEIQPSGKFNAVNLPSNAFPATRVFAFKDISACVTRELELLMWGAIPDPKSGSKFQTQPTRYMLDLSEGVTTVDGNGNQIFVLDNQGRTHFWDLATSNKFRRYSLGEQEAFSEIYTGRGFQILLKSFVEPSLSFLEIEEAQTMETYKPVSFRVKLMDKYGQHHYTPTYPLRYYLFISQDPQNPQDLQERAVWESIKALKQSKKAPSPSISVIAQGDVIIRDVSIKPDTDDLSIHILNFTLQHDGQYCVYVFINEQLIKEMPMHIKLERSLYQETAEEREVERLRMALDMERKKEEMHQQKQNENEMTEEGIDYQALKPVNRPAPLNVKKDIKSPTGGKIIGKGNTGNVKSPNVKMTSPTGTKGGIQKVISPNKLQKSPTMNSTGITGKKSPGIGVKNVKK